MFLEPNFLNLVYQIILWLHSFFHSLINAPTFGIYECIFRSFVFTTYVIVSYLLQENKLLAFIFFNY